jgi:hypothetical protein
MASGSTAMLMDSTAREEADCGRHQEIAGARMRCDLPLSAVPCNVSVAVEKNATACFGCRSIIKVLVDGLAIDGDADGRLDDSVSTTSLHAATGLASKGLGAANRLIVACDTP